MAVLYFRPVVSLRTFIALIFVLAVTSGCMMPDPAKQRAANEAKLLEEGLTVPFYKANADGSYQVDDKDTPVLDPDVKAPAFALHGAAGLEYAYDPAESVGHTLVLVIPTSNAPNSLQQLKKLATLAPSLSGAGIEVIAVCADPVGDLPSVSGTDDSTLTLLSDVNGSFLIPYGCKTEKMEFPQRTMIGLAPGGEVRFFTRGFAYQTERQILEAFGISE